MDLFIVDYDCQRLMQDSEGVFITSETKMVYLGDENISGDFELNNFIIKNVTRCIILTRFLGGVKKYHWDIVSKNSTIKHWVISIINLEQDVYEKQLLKQVDNLLFDLDVFYEVVFDTSEDLAQTKRILSRSAKTKRKCIIASKNIQLAENAAGIFKRYLEGWDIEIPKIKNSNDYQYADAVLVVGENETDCAVAAPEIGLNKRRIWINQRLINNDEKDTMFDRLEEAMNANGWNIADYSSKTYFSDLLYESFMEQLHSGEMSCISLSEQEDFVIWDAYGLPLTREGYTNEAEIGRAHV